MPPSDLRIISMYEKNLEKANTKEKVLTVMYRVLTILRIPLYYFLISLVKAIPINPAPIPISHPA